MSLTELARTLGIDKSQCCRLVKRGMPIASASAAQAWRVTNAPPRAKRGGRKSTAPPTSATIAPPVTGATGADTPEVSLANARSAERQAFGTLVQTQESGSSLDDLRKASLIYIASRANRVRAEKDFAENQRQEGILLYYDEARDIAGRPHLACKNMLDAMPKTLAPRLHGQPQKAIERTLAEWCDTLMAVIRDAI